MNHCVVGGRLGAVWVVYGDAWQRVGLFQTVEGLFGNRAVWLSKIGCRESLVFSRSWPSPKSHHLGASSNMRSAASRQEIIITVKGTRDIVLSILGMIP